MRFAWLLVRQQRRTLALGALLIVLGRGAALALPAISRLLYDDVILAGRTELLPVAAGLVLGAIAVVALTSFLLTTRVELVAQRTITELRSALQGHALTLPIAWHDGTRSGMTVARIMTDPEGAAALIGSGVVRLVTGMLTAVFGTAVLLYLNWQLTIAAVVLLTVFAAALAFAVARLRPLHRTRAELSARVSGRLTETFAAIRFVKVAGGEGHEHAVFREGVERMHALMQRLMQGAALLSAFTTLLVGGVTVLVIVMGVGAVTAGAMTPGELLWFATTAGMVAAPLPHVASNAVQLTQALAALDRVAELRAAAPEPSADRGRAAPRPLRGDVAFEDVSFQYTNGCAALERVNFRAPAGSTTAIVGASGAGKSTLLWLLTGIHAPQSGRILIDGIDLRELSLRSYRSQLGVVLQDDVLFDGTVRANIAYAQHASETQIVRAARLAQADGFIRALPEGYDTIIGERGVRLSGGQRQRIAIARALVRAPALLLLDEATSSVDALNDEAVHEALHAARAGRTTFIIAHRLATVRHADQILVLERGRVAQCGTHAELIGCDGPYRRLHAPELEGPPTADSMVVPLRPEVRVHARS